MLSDDGATAVEYAILASAIAAVIVAAAFLVGGVTREYFERFYELILLH
jgi:Flp pilus assembly pilin Flp